MSDIFLDTPEPLSGPFPTRVDLPVRKAGAAPYFRAAYGPAITSRSKTLQEARTQAKGAVYSQMVHLGTLKQEALLAAMGKGLNAQAIPARWRAVFVAEYKRCAKRLLRKAPR